MVGARNAKIPSERTLRRWRKEDGKPPLPNGTNKAGCKKPIRSSISAVRQVFERIDAIAIPYYELHEKSGVHAQTLTTWKRGGKSPNWQGLESVIVALGGRIKIEWGDETCHLKS